MLPKDFEYHNGNGTLCLIGTYDEDTETFTEEKNQAVDYGIDFYASQTILTQDGRRIMIGWMQNWDTCNLRSMNNEKWYGQMSIPREISVKNGRLYQQPVREIETLRGRHVSYENVPVTGNLSLEGIGGRKADITITVRADEASALYQKWSIRFAQNEEYRTSLSLRPHEGVLKVDRKCSGSRRAIIHQRRSKVPGCENGSISLRIILDRYSAEVFVNGGEQVMSATFYTPLEADRITFLCDGTARMDVDFYELR